MTELVVLTEQAFVLVEETTSSTVDIFDESTVTLTSESFTLISENIQGPPGVSAIGGFGYDIQNLAAGDLLMFNGSAWGNSNKLTISDGGNF